MTKKEFLDHLEATFQNCLKTADAKNSDYSDDKDPFKNFNGTTIIGITPEKGIMVRIMDKITRIGNLLDREAQVKDEKIEDTIKDAITYLAILLAKLESNGDRKPNTNSNYKFVTTKTK